MIPSINHGRLLHAKRGITSLPTTVGDWPFKTRPGFDLTNVTQELRLCAALSSCMAVYNDICQDCSVIFWEDVRELFADAQYLLDGDTIVPFITDEDFEYVMPLRFEYMPGAVLDVVTEKTIDVAVDAGATAVDNLITSERGNAPSDMPAKLHFTTKALMDRDGPRSKRLPPPTFQGDIDEDDDEDGWKNSDIQRQCPSPDLRTSTAFANVSVSANVDTVEHSKPHSCQHAGCDLHFDNADDLKSHLKIHLEEVQPIYCHVQGCNKKFAKLKNLRHHEDTVHTVKEKQVVANRMQKSSILDSPMATTLQSLQAPIPLSPLQQKIKSVVFRKYRLHELSTPRLFILLPEKALDPRTYGESRRFRLFFLCGATDPEVKLDSSGPARLIHLSSDKGYEIRDADVFFNKYAGYALTMMEYAKHGYRDPQVDIPPMETSRTLEEHRFHSIKLTKQDFTAAVDETIAFLQRRLSESYWNEPSAIEDLGDRDLWETVDLRQLISFLVHQPEDGVPGNLYRAIPKNGPVIWMCLDHHRLHYSERDFNVTKTVLERQGGTFDEQLRRIKFTTECNDPLNLIYKAGLDKYNRDVQEICVRLERLLKLDTLFNIPMLNDYRLSISGTGLDRMFLGGDKQNVECRVTCVDLQDLIHVAALFTIGSCMRVLTISTSQSTTVLEEKSYLTSILISSPVLVELELTVKVLNATEVLDCILESKATNHDFRLLTLKTQEKDVASISFHQYGNSEVLKVARISIVFGSNYSTVGRTKFCTLFRQYGWCIQSLDTNDTFVDHHATILAIPTKGKEYKLTRLVLNAVSLSAVGLGCLDVIIYRSKKLQYLSLLLERLHNEEQFEKALFLLRRYGARLTKLTLSGDSTVPWITKLAEKFPTRCIWPRLRTFQIVCPLDWYDIRGIRKEWDAEVVAAPSPQTSKSLAVTADAQLGSACSSDVHRAGINTATDTSMMREGHSGWKEGYLRKRAQYSEWWATRYFVLRGPVLEYFGSKDGHHLGSITLTNADIVRQQSTDKSQEASADGSNAGTVDANSHRRTIVILEPKTSQVMADAEKSPSSLIRHVLCAETDKERDDWVEALMLYVGKVPTDVPDATNRPERSGKKSPEVQKLSFKPVKPRNVNGVFGGFFLNRKDYGKQRRLVPPSHQPPQLSSQGRHVPPPQPPTTQGMSMKERKPRRPSDDNRFLSTSKDNSPLQQQQQQQQQQIPRSASSQSLPQDDESARLPSLASSPSFLLRGTVLPSLFGMVHHSAKNTKDTNPSALPGPGSHPSLAPIRQVFGVTLEQAIEQAQVQPGYELPAVVYRCIEYLNAHEAKLEEGIYRLNGSAAIIKGLKERFNQDGDVALLAEEGYYDIHAVAGLLKQFLRDLPSSILTRELHRDFLQVIELTRRSERVDELTRLVAVLPEANYTLLRVLAAHLIEIVASADVNKMTERNVGIVFSPILGIPAGVFALLMSDFDQIFRTEVWRLIPFTPTRRPRLTIISECNKSS